MMSQASFLANLLNYSKDMINEETVELLLAYIEQEDYNMETAKRVCGDVAGLLSWTKAMAYFYGINKEVLPLKVHTIYLFAVLLSVCNLSVSIGKSDATGSSTGCCR